MRMKLLRLAAWAIVLGLAAGCAARPEGAASAGSGITVFGTVDAGVSHQRHR